MTQSCSFFPKQIADGLGFWEFHEIIKYLLINVIYELSLGLSSPEVIISPGSGPAGLLVLLSMEWLGSHGSVSWLHHLFQEPTLLWNVEKTKQKEGKEGSLEGFRETAPLLACCCFTTRTKHRALKNYLYYWSPFWQVFNHRTTQRKQVQVLAA